MEISITMKTEKIAGTQGKGSSLKHALGELEWQLQTTCKR